MPRFQLHLQYVHRTDPERNGEAATSRGERPRGERPRPDLYRTSWSSRSTRTSRAAFLAQLNTPRSHHVHGIKGAIFWSSFFANLWQISANFRKLIFIESLLLFFAEERRWSGQELARRPDGGEGRVLDFQPEDLGRSFLQQSIFLQNFRKSSWYVMQEFRRC